MSFDFSGSFPTSIYTQEQPVCQHRVSRQHAFAFSTVACPHAKNEFCRFTFAQFVNTQLPLNFVGQESFLAWGCRRPRERCPLPAPARGAAPSLGSMVCKGPISCSMCLLLFNQWEESMIKRDFLG